MNSRSKHLLASRCLAFTTAWAIAASGHPSAQGQQTSQPSTPRHSVPTPQVGSPRTVAETSGFTKTSRLADVEAFLKELQSLPHGKLLTRRSLGKSAEGRDIWCVQVRHPDLDTETAIRVVINANIHAGEVEGKEVAQILLREIAEGQGHELLTDLWLHVIPIYNVDGNENVDRKHRISQNGPDDGVGQRPNSQGLDLNRDFIKAETPECQALLTLIRDLDPHVFMDLHTTNGSPHAYHLTYAPSLCPDNDPELDRIAREDLLGPIRQTMAKNHDFRIFDYGNFARSGGKRWATYDHRPRFGTNYVGLRNRIGILSEAFSYQPFATRVAVTRQFVLENLRAIHKHRTAIQSACDAADATLVNPETPATFGFDATYGPAEHLDILVGSITRKPIEGLGVRYVAGDAFKPEPMDVFRSFVARTKADLPTRGWTVSARAAAAIAPALKLHGVRFETTEAGTERALSAFKVTEIERAKRPFQGHHELKLQGSWQPARTVQVAAGALFVPARQPLARLAAWLLEPKSDDSLSTWNALEPWTAVDGEYPVQRENEPNRR